MAKLSQLPDSGTIAELSITELGTAGTTGGWLVSDSGSPPIATASGDHPTSELSDDGDGLSAETGNGNDIHGLDLAIGNISSLVSGDGITSGQAPQTAAGAGIHLDSALLHSVATKVSAVWQFAGTGYTGSDVADTPVFHTAAGSAPTSTVTSNSLLAADLSAIDPIFETRVASAGDDVEEKGSGTISGNISDLELGYDSSTRQTVGIRFTGIDIPKGAIITSAYIQFQANEVKTGAASLLIQGDNVDDASPFTTASFNVSSLPRTTASTAWTPDPWNTIGEQGLAERTPDLTAIVQEIVNRSGWAALNDMAFLITGTGTRTADSYEYNPASAPLLHVEYTLPGPPSAPVAFNTPPDADPATNQIAELAAAGDPTGITASATDPDAGSTVTYSLGDARFAIDASTGVITRSANGTLDFETQSSINLTVTATSSDGSTANQTFTLAVLDSPEPVAFNTPPDANTAANQIAQNAAAGTAVGITASAKDPDAGSTVTYTIDDTRFAINASTGVITRSSTGTLNAQSEPTVTLTVTATSSDGSIDTHAFTVSVTASQQPVAFNTPPDADPTTNQIAELAAAGAPTGITASATDPDAGSTVTYSINDARFAINSSTGVITRSATGTLDFETQSSINLTVTATSSDGSTANKSFTLAVLDSPEPVAFNTPPDANTAANQIAQNAAAGTAVGITASAKDPDAGSTVTYTIDDTRFAINSSTGVITRSSTGTLDAQSEPSINLHVTATSSDGSIATHAFTVDVTASQLPTSVTLAHTILTSQWSPPSPDPTDIVYISHLGTLLVADSEVDEMSIFTGKNLYQMNLNGTLAGTLTTINFSDEPAGVTYNPTNHHLFFSDDTGTKSVYELNPGKDGLYNTSDDIVTSFKTSAFGSSDSESLAYDTKRGVLYLEDGSTHTIYTIAPGQNGKFDGVPSTGGDDVVTSFSVQSLGTPSDGGIAYDPVHDLLYVIVSRNSVAMVTPTGDLLGTLDISAANAKKPSGLALAPSSDDPAHHMSLYITDRGVDNDSNPTENDGKIYEFHLNDWLLA